MSIGSAAASTRAGAEAKEFYRDRTLLVTGGAGMIGSNLVSALLQLEPRCVVVIDDLSASRRWNLPESERIRLVEGSIVDESALALAFDLNPSVVFHLAAFFANQRSVEYPEEDLLVNGLGTLRVLGRAASLGSRVVYASSGCGVYGAQPPLGVTEDMTSTYPSTPYQVTKLLGELYANFFHHQYRLAVTKLRFFNVYGPGELPGRYRNVIPNFFYWAMRGATLPITGDGTESRDFTFVDDAVVAVLRAGFVSAAIGEELNIASERETRIGDLAETINRMTGNQAGVAFRSRRHWDTKARLSASIARARKVLGYEPGTGIEAGLKRVHEWFRRNWPRVLEDADFGEDVGVGGSA